MVLWIFGYGSLIWNPGFRVDEKILGYIKDYRRVFYLVSSSDLHIGSTEGAICWGRAYCVRGGPEKEKLAMEYLERRECEYDIKGSVDFYTEEGEYATPFLTGVLVFTSTPNNAINKYYLGPAPLEEMARQIAKAAGPCGNNRDYLFKLEKTMAGIGHEDQGLIKLANEVRRILGGIHDVLNLHYDYYKLLASCLETTRG